MFETSTRWWTVERNANGITLQRSVEIELVKNKFVGKDRPGLVHEFINCSAQGTMEDLLKLIHEKNFLCQPYDFMFNNSKIFSAKVFNCLNSKNRTCIVAPELPIISGIAVAILNVAGYPDVSLLSHIIPLY